MKVVDVVYTNWRGETRNRSILPHPETLRFGVNEWHKEPQWLIKATCLESQTIREFAMSGFTEWGPAAHQELPWRVVAAPKAMKQMGGIVVGTAHLAEPLEFPNLDKNTDGRDIQIIRGATYLVTDEQIRKYGKEFARLGIKTIQKPPGA